MSSEECQRGVHLTGLRVKNVAVLFIDIVRFSRLCDQPDSEAGLQIILQTFLNFLETPVFRCKGLSKRLGDGVRTQISVSFFSPLRLSK